MIHVFSIIFAYSIGESVEQFHVGKILGQSQLRKLCRPKVVVLGQTEELHMVNLPVLL